MNNLGSNECVWKKWDPSAGHPYPNWGPGCGYQCDCINTPPNHGGKCKPGGNNPCPADLAKWYQGPKGGVGLWGVPCNWKKCDTDNSCNKCVTGDKSSDYYKTCVDQCSTNAPYIREYPQSWNACWADCCSNNACHDAPVVVLGQHSVDWETNPSQKPNRC